MLTQPRHKLCLANELLPNEVNYVNDRLRCGQLASPAWRERVDDYGISG
jgi:hypothetical protein